MIPAPPRYGLGQLTSNLTFSINDVVDDSICVQKTFLLSWLTLSPFILPLLTTAATVDATHAGKHETIPLEITHRSSRTVGFTQLHSHETEIRFVNELKGDAFLTDAVAHNGSGVALGDVNDDGWVDAYFCNLQGPNKLYINKGNWTFSEINLGLASCADQRSTAAALVDVDGDRDLDLLVNGIAVGTRLFLNEGNGKFRESKESGLSKVSSPFSMALADIDADGDLDLYCAHYIDEMHMADPTTDYKLTNQNGQHIVTHVNGRPTTNPRLRNRFIVSKKGRLRELPEADGVYLNNGEGQFQAVQYRKGTFNTTDGKPVQPPRDWSLAVMLRDLNQDGSPDIYVCTDNATPDRIWINNGDGTFNALDRDKIRHTSRSSMGVDMADINRDGVDDFYVVDMFAREGTKRMTQLAKQHSSPAVIQQVNGIPRYNRNTLFKGRADGSFSEIALMAGIAATDWSWCPVFLDVDLDGYEDLLVTNGFSFDVMDQDSQDQLRTMQLSKFDRKRSRQFHPPFITKNASFRNAGNGYFEPADNQWGFNISGISYGMAVGDLDNDGDLDAVINQLNASAVILRNDATAPRVKVTLKGPAHNRSGIGARIRLLNQTLIQSQTIHAGGRYLSSDEPTRTFAISSKESEPVTLEIIWPNKRVTRIPDIVSNQHYVVRYSEEQSSKEQSVIKNVKPLFTDVSHLLNFRHRTRPGIPSSTNPSKSLVEPNAPSLSWQDINDDGWEDLWISGGANQSPGIFINREGKRFEALKSEPAQRDALGISVPWNNGQGKKYWVAAASHRLTHPERNSALYFFSGTSTQPELQIDIGPDGIGALCVADIDMDGDQDLFVGSTSPYNRYPEPADSQIWLNQNGTLKKSSQWSEVFKEIGYVNAAVFFDLEGDDLPDLAIAAEWGPVKVFRNSPTGFIDRSSSLGLNTQTGRWTFVAAGDFDNDGRMDLVAGNKGLNTSSALHHHSKERIWFGDNSENSTVQSIESVLIDESWLPMEDRNVLSMLFPDIPLVIKSHHHFSRSSINSILETRFEQFNYLENQIHESSVFLNQKDGFKRLPLLQEAQESPVFSISLSDINKDHFLDIFLGQNKFPDNLEVTRNDNGQGIWLLGDGKGSFRYAGSVKTGIEVFGQARGSSINDFNKDGKPDLVLVQKNGESRLFRGF